MAISINQAHNLAREGHGRTAMPLVTMGQFAGDQLSKFGRTQVGSWARVLKVHVAHAEVTSSLSLCLSLSLSLARSLSLSLSRPVARSARSLARAYFAPHAGALFLGVRFLSTA